MIQHNLYILSLWYNTTIGTPFILFYFNIFLLINTCSMNLAMKVSLTLDSVPGYQTRGRESLLVYHPRGKSQIGSKDTAQQKRILCQLNILNLKESVSYCLILYKKNHQVHLALIWLLCILDISNIGN